jgi:hypothetical protein
MYIGYDMVAMIMYIGSDMVAMIMYIGYDMVAMIMYIGSDMVAMIMYSTLVFIGALHTLYLGMIKVYNSLPHICS